MLSGRIHDLKYCGYLTCLSPSALHIKLQELQILIADAYVSVAFDIFAVAVSRKPEGHSLVVSAAAFGADYELAEQLGNPCAVIKICPADKIAKVNKVGAVVTEFL